MSASWCNTFIFLFNIKNNTLLRYFNIVDAVAVVAPYTLSMSMSYNYNVYIQRTSLCIRTELCSFVTIPYKSLWQSENLCKHLKITWKFVFECALFLWVNRRRRRQWCGGGYTDTYWSWHWGLCIYPVIPSVLCQFWQIYFGEVVMRRDTQSYCLLFGFVNGVCRVHV